MTTHTSDLQTFISISSIGIGVTRSQFYSGINTIKDIASNNKFLITNESLIASNPILNYNTYQYTILFDIDTEEHYETFLENLTTNIGKITQNVSIAGYTRPSNLIYIYPLSTGIMYKENNRLKGTINLVVEWSF